MNNQSMAILAHRGECKGALAYEDVSAPFDAERLLFLPLCVEKLAPEKIIPQLRLTASGCELCVVTVPVLEEKLASDCKPGWAGSYPCARCVMERWGEVLRRRPRMAGTDTPGEARIRR